MLTDETGAPIPEDDPRIPNPILIADAKARADRAASVLAANGLAVDGLVTLEAKVEALASLQIPPEGAVRNLYEYRVQTKREETLVRMVKAAEEAQRGPALQIASSVPQDLRLEVVPK